MDDTEKREQEGGTGQETLAVISSQDDNKQNKQCQRKQGVNKGEKHFEVRAKGLD